MTIWRGAFAGLFIGSVLFMGSCGGSGTSTPHLTSVYDSTKTVLPPGGSAPTDNPADQKPTDGLGAEEEKCLSLINAFRAEQGVAPLQISIRLVAASVWLSTDMATKGYFDHTDSSGRDPFTRMNDFGYEANSMGENIAAGNGDAESTFNQWKNSAGHRANMLSKGYTAIGIGRAYSADSPYGWYWTTDFGSSLDP